MNRFSAVGAFILTLAAATAPALADTVNVPLQISGYPNGTTFVISCSFGVAPSELPINFNPAYVNTPPPGTQTTNVTYTGGSTLTASFQVPTPPPIAYASYVCWSNRGGSVAGYYKTRS